MILKETVSIDDIKAILCSASIYDTITGDTCPRSSDFEPPIDNDHFYVGGYVKGEIIALMVYHKYMDGNKCHVQVLPEYRKEYARKFGEQSLLFRGTLPLYAEIPELYKNVLDFALLNDFKVIDVKKGDYIKNGQTYNVNVLEYNYGIRS
tara:strand:- start:79 stop:528 length:450 start_codon:yes stop_codon:yes gene_type:complete